MRQPILHRDDQRIAGIIVAFLLIGSCLYFWQRSVTNRGLIDFENLPQRQAEFLVNLNAADRPELSILPGIGEKLAKQIIRYRNSHGAFTSTSQLVDVPGIGPAKLKAIEGQVFVDEVRLVDDQLGDLGIKDE